MKSQHMWMMGTCSPVHCMPSVIRREENCFAGGGGDMEAHFPNQAIA